MSDVNTELIQGNCIDVMGSMEPESVHAIVTDPPYGLAFMGNSWDDFEPKEYQEWCEKWAIEALRVLKPGGHMLAFSGSRTFHRLFVGVEDAGFEVRDTIMWMYGSGFPKGQDIGKAIDKKKGEEPEKVRKKDNSSPMDKAATQTDTGRYAWNEDNDEKPEIYETVPGSEDGKKWDGWNTQLKPAFEPVVVARKPLEEDTIVEQVMATGTGALNIDGCRIATDEELTGGAVGTDNPNMNTLPGDEREEEGQGMFANPKKVEPNDGRHPANVTLDEDAARMLDEQTGELKSGSLSSDTYSDGTGREALGGFDGEFENRGYSENSGGASRFFYTAKAKRSERTVGGRIENPHPTIKPIDLMEWLVKLVSAEGQIVLDPFAGTGTTLMAAYNVGRNAIGIEKDSDYMETAKERVRANEEYIDEVGTEPDHVYNEATDW